VGVPHVTVVVPLEGSTVARLHAESHEDETQLAADLAGRDVAREVLYALSDFFAQRVRDLDDEDTG
jgi:hypothetical protein